MGPRRPGPRPQQSDFCQRVNTGSGTIAACAFTSLAAGDASAGGGRGCRPLTRAPAGPVRVACASSQHGGLRGAAALAHQLGFPKASPPAQEAEATLPLMTQAQNCRTCYFLHLRLGGVSGLPRSTREESSAPSGPEGAQSHGRSTPDGASVSNHLWKKAESARPLPADPERGEREGRRRTRKVTGVLCGGQWQ